VAFNIHRIFYGYWNPPAKLWHLACYCDGWKQIWFLAELYEIFRTLFEQRKVRRQSM